MVLSRSTSLGSVSLLGKGPVKFFRLDRSFDLLDLCMRVLPALVRCRNSVHFMPLVGEGVRLNLYAITVKLQAFEPHD